MTLPALSWVAVKGKASTRRGPDSVPQGPSAICHPHLAARFCNRCGQKRGGEGGPCPCGAFNRIHPRPCACVLAFRDDGRCLLVRRSIDPRRGLWQVPGGFMEIDESPEDGGRRELREEAHLEVGSLTLLGVYTPVETGLVVFAFAGAAASGGAEAGHEVEEVGWFAPDEIPWDRISFTSSELALHEWLRRRGYPSPQLQTTWGG